MSIPQCIIVEIPDTLRQRWHLMIFTEYFGNSSEKLSRGNVFNMPYSSIMNSCLAPDSASTSLGVLTIP